ncbi:MAG: YdcF family protein [Oscillospiraceae bacterium]|nr:YdcF family protein [Oscillospiraceae bacterium]
MRRAEAAWYSLAALCLLLGGLMRFVFTAVRFTGLLFWCAAGVLVVFALLERWKGKYRWAAWLRRLVLLALAAGFAFFAVLEVWVVSWSGTDWDAEPEAMVVFGAGLNGAAPSLSLTSRLEAALAYAEDWPEIPIVVSGSQGRGEDISEARCMADWLAGRGVPPERIYLEEQAGNTEENVRYSQALLASLGVPAGAEVALVSSDYHLCRARLLWGEGAVPVGARLPGRYFPLTVNYYVREAFAVAEALVF